MGRSLTSAPTHRGAGGTVTIGGHDDGGPVGHRCRASHVRKVAALTLLGSIAAATFSCTLRGRTGGSLCHEPKGRF